jgi:hypothetical protein
VADEIAGGAEHQHRRRRNTAFGRRRIQRGVDFFGIEPVVAVDHPHVVLGIHVDADDLA